MYENVTRAEIQHRPNERSRLESIKDTRLAFKRGLVFAARPKTSCKLQVSGTFVIN